jgi:hypothetical protein
MHDIMVGRDLAHGGHVHDTHHPLRRFPEQVAGNEAISMGHDSGLVAG